MRLTARHSLAFLAGVALAALAAPAAAVDPGSELITCDHADERVEITVTSHLDPSCTWTRGVEILASNVTLDCQDAHIAAPDRRYGVYIHAPTDTPLTNITVRNCHVEGFLNNFHIEREGFRDLAEGVEYENGFSNITIEDSTSLNSRGVGIFVERLRRGRHAAEPPRRGRRAARASTSRPARRTASSRTARSSTTASARTVPPGGTFTFAGVDFWFWGTGREGLAIDGSRFNIVRNNTLPEQLAGGIFLYKNCGEFVTQRPERWFHRRYGADGNVIENNTFIDEDNGVWIGSRMGENTLPMECSDPQYLPGYALDYADDNVVRDNMFQNVTFGVRVEDDDATVTDNEFVSADAIDEAIVVGTRYRTEALSQPVDGTTITGNVATIAGSPNPYRWIWGHTNTTFGNNGSLGRVVGLCEGVQPPVGPFVDDGRRRGSGGSREPAQRDPRAAAARGAAAVRDRLRDGCSGVEGEPDRQEARHAARGRHADVQGRAGPPAPVRTRARPGCRRHRGGDRGCRRSSRARRRRCRAAPTTPRPGWGGRLRPAGRAGSTSTRPTSLPVASPR